MRVAERLGQTIIDRVVVSSPKTQEIGLRLVPLQTVAGQERVLSFETLVSPVEHVVGDVCVRSKDNKIYLTTSIDKDWDQTHAAIYHKGV